MNNPDFLPITVTTLSALPNFVPKKYRLNYSEKLVSASLKKLGTLGFVKKCYNPKKTSTGGSPAKAFNETAKMIDLQKSIQAQLDNHREKALGTISRFADIEESLSLKDSGKKVRKMEKEDEILQYLLNPLYLISLAGNLCGAKLGCKS